MSDFLSRIVAKQMACKIEKLIPNFLVEFSNTISRKLSLFCLISSKDYQNYDSLVITMTKLFAV